MVAGYLAALDGGYTATFYKHGCIHAIEAAIVATIGTASLADGGLREGHSLLGGYQQRILIGLAALISMAVLG